MTTKRETHAVTIKGAVEPGTGRHLSLQEAQDKGIVDLKRQCYHDPSTGQDTPLRDAIANNLIFADDSDINESEVSICWFRRKIVNVTLQTFKFSMRL